MILITGASGNVGGELTQQLLEMGQNVRVLTRDPQKLSALKGQVDLVVGDLAKPETLSAALTGIERLFLVTASTQQDMNVLKAAKEAGVKHVVKLSTLEAADPHMTEHVKWHRQREELIRASGLAWTFLRPTMFMSTALEWTKSICQEDKIYYPGGEGKVPAVDPWDVAAVAAAALTGSGHEGQAYALTGPTALSFGEMAKVLGGVLGKPIEYVDISEQAAGEGMRKAGLAEYVIEGLIGTFAVIRTGRLAYCSDDVERITGHAPHSFEAWCRANRAAFACLPANR